MMNEREDAKKHALSLIKQFLLALARNAYFTESKSRKFRRF